MTSRLLSALKGWLPRRERVLIETPFTEADYASFGAHSSWYPGNTHCWIREVYRWRIPRRAERGKATK